MEDLIQQWPRPKQS